jgi:hypothetical protein
MNPEAGISMIVNHELASQKEFLRGVTRITCLLQIASLQAPPFAAQ